MYKIIFFLIAFIFSFQLLSQIDTAKSRQYFNSGKEKLRKLSKKNCTDATSDFENALKYNPKSKDANLYYYLGRSQFCLDSFKLAISNVTKAIMIDSNNYDYYYARGEFNRCSKRYKEAIEDFNKMYQISDNNYTKDCRGECFYFLDRFDEAIEDYNSFMEGYKAATNKSRYLNSLSTVYLQRGESYFWVNQYDLAIKDMNKYDSIEKNKYGYAHSNLLYLVRGMSKIKLGDVDGFKDLDKFITTNYVGNPKMYFEIGKAYTFSNRAEDIPKAIKFLTKSIQMDSTEYYLEGNTYIAYTYCMNKEYTKSKSIIDKLESMTSINRYSFYMLKSEVSYYLHDTASVLSSFQRMVDIDINNLHDILVISCSKLVTKNSTYNKIIFDLFDKYHRTIKDVEFYKLYEFYSLRGYYKLLINDKTGISDLDKAEIYPLNDSLKNLGTLCIKAVYYIQHKEFNKAKVLMNKIKHIKKYENYLLIAEYDRELGKYKKSCKYAKKASVLKPDNSTEFINCYCNEKVSYNGLYKLFATFPDIEFWR